MFDCGVFIYNGRMKRLVLSIIGGVAVPTVYTLIAGLLYSQTNSLALKRLLPWPVWWPVRVYLYLFNLHPKSGFEFEEPYVTAVTLICNFLFYASLTYLTLWALSKKEPRRLYS
jgi:hypothetical protein